MLIAQLETEPAALARIRAHAYATTDVARDIVNRRLCLDRD